MDINAIRRGTLHAAVEHAASSTGQASADDSPSPGPDEQVLRRSTQSSRRGTSKSRFFRNVWVTIRNGEKNAATAWAIFQSAGARQSAKLPSRHAVEIMVTRQVSAALTVIFARSRVMTMNSVTLSKRPSHVM